MRDGSYKFSPQKGILKKRKSSPGEPPKEPRPIVVAPAKNRIVQRAILDVCQSDDMTTKKRLGGLIEVLRCPTSVGGLPERGVPEAIALIGQAMAAGATWYVRSDLKDFFQAVPKQAVKDFLAQNISDSEFVRVFMDALSTELENEDEVRALLRLFPKGEIGVPQGSALSALCANIVLAQFDSEFNRRGVVTIRYLDDFVILGRGKIATEKAFRAAAALLKKLGFECHDPFDKGSKKAAAGPVHVGFQFLSFDLKPSRLAPSRQACGDFLADIDEAIAKAKSAIAGNEDQLRRAEPRYIQSLALIDRKIRGWGDAFRASNDRLLFAQLDSKVDQRIAAFQKWFERQIAARKIEQRRRLLGIALLSDTPSNDAEEKASRLRVV
ncbi:MAG: reverse transcriptase domain-containing protein [Rhizomicrobium sp.]